MLNESQLEIFHCEENKLVSEDRLKIHRDYERKCEKEGSYHSLIYGSQITNYVEETELFKKYSLPQYGYLDSGEDFIGFEYGRIYGLYDKLHYTYKGDLTLTQAEVPEEIKIIFKRTYPELEGSCLALIQNVRNFHYVCGSIVHGYWIKMKKEGYDEWYDDIYEASFGVLTNNLEIVKVAHNMKDVPSEFIIGIRMVGINGDEQEVAGQFSTTYSSLNSGLPSRNKVLSVLHEYNSDIEITALPMLCFVQEMCYCCT